VCTALADLLAVEASSDWSETWRTADEAAGSAVSEALEGHARPIEPQMARDVHAAVPRGGAFVIASSMPIRDVDAFASPRDGIRVVSNRGVSGIDGFVSTTLGVALAHDGPVVALAGDLSMLHDRNGFLLSPEADGIDATFVVIDNDGGGIFHLLPPVDYPGTFERVFGTPHGLDFEKIARTHGLGYTRLGAANEVDLAVRVAVDTGGIHLLHVRTDREVNAELHRRIQASVTAAIA
jgi:2-succinyl-5-enolpyruvyl-6-hydroxy-3-cyclohexene-1-carboxylate synthase